MKVVLMMVCVSILAIGCEKCYECTADLPVFLANGQPTGLTMEYTDDFCGRKPVTKPKVDGYEELGYVCTEVNN